MYNMYIKCVICCMYRSKNLPVLGTPNENIVSQPDVVKI